MDEIVKVELVELDIHILTGCGICRYGFKPGAIVARVTSGKHNGFVVCDNCLRARDFDDKLAKEAAALEAQAALARSMIGRLDVPTFEQFEAATKAAEKRFARFLDGPTPLH